MRGVCARAPRKPRGATLARSWNGSAGERRQAMRLPRGIKRGLGVAGALAVLIGIYAAAVRPWYLRWGTQGDEVIRSLRGDTIVPTGGETTRAITIRAHPQN